MANKVTCPHCDSHTSAVYRAAYDVLPCPHCSGELGERETQRAADLYAMQWDGPVQ